MYTVFFIFTHFLHAQMMIWLSQTQYTHFKLTDFATNPDTQAYQFFFISLIFIILMHE